jgi:hypothetical protein
MVERGKASLATARKPLSPQFSNRCEPQNVPRSAGSESKSSQNSAGHPGSNPRAELNVEAVVGIPKMTEAEHNKFPLGRWTTK